MTFTEKRQAKKIARRLFILGYTLMFAFAILSIGGLIGAVVIETEVQVSVTLIALLCGSLMIGALVSSIIGQHYLNKRVAYKQGIAMYRQYSYFTNSINLIIEGGKEAYDKAVNTYELIHSDTELRTFVFSFIVTSNYFSKDKKLIEKGQKRLISILDSYDPEKVDLNKKISLL